MAESKRRVEKVDAGKIEACSGLVVLLKGLRKMERIAQQRRVIHKFWLGGRVAKISRNDLEAILKGFDWRTMNGPLVWSIISVPFPCA